MLYQLSYTRVEPNPSVGAEKRVPRAGPTPFYRCLQKGGGQMPLLWLLVVVLIILALAGGVAVSNWLFLVLLIAVILALVAYF